MIKRKKLVRKGVCLPLLLVVIILTCIGLVMVLSSSYNSILIKNKDASYLNSFRTQAIVGAVAVLGMLFLSRLDYHWLTKKFVLIGGWTMCVGLLILVFFFAPVRNSHRWFSLGPVTVQPSEIAKAFGVVYAAWYTSKNKWWYNHLFQWLGLLVPLLPLGFLIIREPDLSTTLIFAFAIVAVMFVSGMPIGYLVVCGVAAAGLIFVMTRVTTYHTGRFDSWLHAWDDPKDKGYQVVQSLYAIGDGGLFGVGLGNSKQKITHLPMSDSDYIFSIICEEFGFVGAAVVIVLYVVFLYFGLKTAMEAADSFGAYLATGLTLLIAAQAFINMCVATNLFPSTGVTLPFISKGASSLGVMLCSSGLILSVSGFKSREVAE